ncbi:glycerophosphodiester phosphodiesterase family protein [Xanthomonas sp. JAI131]|uniref:glycerophosphodiester phosphodiesterase family protein n=1 Tax=Xanthomonas sp. JAI131 TaxID=2723067 RepID=UPI0021065BE4|nr:glycerophosphodiester phosphodiesterase family protein [Xanthomonas sp. JAI131]
MRGFRSLAVLLSLLSCNCLPAFAGTQANGPDSYSGSYDRPGRPAIVGHRGAAGIRPENTLSSFREALELGADALETDVHLTQDGVWVINHDFFLNPDVARDGDGQWNAPKTPLSAMTYAQIERYDIGRARPGSAYAREHSALVAVDGERVPTLDQLIALIRGHDDTTQLFLEIKSLPIVPGLSAGPEVLARRVVQALNKNDFKQRTYVLCFDWNVLRAIHRLDPAIRLVFLTQDVKRALARDDARALTNKDAHSVMQQMSGLDGLGGRSVGEAVRDEGGTIWDINYADITAADLAQARHDHLRLGAWTVDDADTARLLYNLGVDYITTNRPDVMLQAFGKDAAVNAPLPPGASR